MALPSAVTIVPLFLIMRDLGWINTYAGMIAPDIAYPFGVFLMRQFMHTVPRELFDAAKVDGASELQVFLRIVLPLTRPALGAIAIFAFINSWTNYIWQTVIINSEDLQTLPVGIAKLASGYQSFDLGLAMAGATVAFLPMLLIFIFFQGYFTKGVTAGRSRAEPAGARSRSQSAVDRRRPSIAIGCRSPSGGPLASGARCRPGPVAVPGPQSSVPGLAVDDVVERSPDACRRRFAAKRRAAASS